MDWLWPTECVACGRLAEGRVCRACRGHDVGRVRLRVRGLAGAWTLAPYDTTLGRALRRAKVDGNRELACVLATLLATRLRPILGGPTFRAVVPAPSTLASRVRRGFAMASVLADAVAADQGLDVHHVLTRRRGRRQAGLDRAGRLANLAGKVRAELSPPGRVLLVDDVVTTGATADACVRELLGAGASEVWLLTLCAVVNRR